MHPYVGWLGRHRLVTVQSSGELTTRNTVASSGALGLVHRSHRDQGVPWMVCGPGGEIVGGERLVSVGLARAADSGIRGILDRVHRGELNWGMGKPGRKRRTNAKIGRLRVVCGRTDGRRNRETRCTWGPLAHRLDRLRLQRGGPGTEGPDVYLSQI